MMTGARVPWADAHGYIMPRLRRYEVRKTIALTPPDIQLPVRQDNCLEHLHVRGQRRHQ